MHIQIAIQDTWKSVLPLRWTWWGNPKLRQAARWEIFTAGLDKRNRTCHGKICMEKSGIGGMLRISLCWQWKNVRFHSSWMQGFYCSCQFLDLGHACGWIIRRGACIDFFLFHIQLIGKVVRKLLWSWLGLEAVLFPVADLGCPQQLANSVQYTL